MIYPRSFSHVGLSVPDLDRAVEFYTKAFGLYVIMPPTTVLEEKDTAIGIMCQHCFGPGFGSYRIAHLATSNGVGFELFEFPQNDGSNCDFDRIPTGLFHYSIQDPDIEGLVQRVVECGGKQRMPICEYYPGEKPYKMCYVEDPFGIVFEIYSHSYELTYSSSEY